MTIYSASDLAQLAVNNGFPNSDSNNLATCVAIALAESGGDSTATSSSDDRGLWQINHAAHGGEFDQRYPDWYDPDANAQMMLAVSSSGANWNPWVTYNNGDYQKHMADAVAAVGGTSYTPGTRPTGTPGGTGSAAQGSIIPASNPLTDNFVVRFFKGMVQGDTWARLGLMLGGAIVILIAFSIYFDKEIISVAKTAAETAAFL